MRGLLFALMGSFLALGGCTSPIDNGGCNPACAPGFMCDNSSNCVPDGTSVDMSAGGGDGSQGGCNPACKGVTPFCNASNHCVGCLTDDQCPIGQRCNVASDVVASCVPGCMTDDRCHMDGQNLTMKCCNKSCVDTATDANNCGDCGMSCTANHARGTCSGSACTVGGCNAGWGDCNNDPKDGCESNLHLDENNCTACGSACMLTNAVQGCSDGCYIKACNFGWDDCNQNTNDGCETSVLSDTSNCGACGMPCTSRPNAQANCTAGNCVLGACLQGFADCNKDPKDGCEVDLTSDAMNCTSCGNPCPNNNPYCNQGVCGQVPPAVTFTDAFVNGKDGQVPGCTDWNAFRGALTVGPYSKVTIKGSNDATGVTCSGAMANQICQALRNNTATSVMCNGRTWATGVCGSGLELTSSAGICQCNTGYTSRPCIGAQNPNWGGVNTTTCSAPSQTITVLCQQ